MNILRGPKGVASVLLARIDRLSTDSPLPAAESAGAWSAWKSTVPQTSPQALVRQMTDSGLRGRGGAGYLTGDKWCAAASVDADVRYVVANGFEADPGAQVDRLLMERDPHAIVEGLALAAYAVGATRAYIAVRANMATALRAFTTAVRAAEEAGYLGTGVLGTGYDLHVEVVAIPGGMVVGEETTLIKAIENKRAQPDQRPPFPTGRGLFGRPTVVNNVETLALVPWIVTNGAAAFAAIGDDTNPGTTLIQISGAVANPGVVEAPLGMSLRKILDLAGGAANAKALLVGGPAGGFLPATELDTLYSPTELAAKGAIWGSGSITVVDESTCIVDMATLLLRYLSDESCGKTIPCRIGVRRLYELGQRATSGLSRPNDPAVAQQLAADVRDGALCGLERLAVNPFTSGMRYFAAEFDQHFTRGTCPAGVCSPVRVVAQPMSA
ncbi:MAG TPA: NADH-ubiquinone oxidoreductase-F iron-sulfur binding region domain-containing protein [Candidatus Limnocylindrales bacterium]|nr:NADH-ubiquinone oxidoreductase-F iron-sulfur binding region domain-containing protein [Candidatus Limnocylindrales bacterium]